METFTSLTYDEGGEKMEPEDQEKAMEVLNDSAEIVSPEFNLGESKHEEKVPNAIQVDVWDKRKAEKIVDEWDLESEKQNPEVDKRSIIADSHTACFNPQPVLDENCDDQVKKQWFEDVLETPEYHHLHKATCLDTEMSQIASIQLYRQYQEYLTGLTSDERDKIENSESGEDGDWGSRVKRSGSAQKGVQQAGQDIRDAKEAAEALGYGTEDGSSSSLGTGVLDAFQGLRNNPKFRAISEAAGRFRVLSKSLQTKKNIHGMDDLVGVTLGDEIGRLVPSELMKLVDEDMENELLLKIHERTAMVRNYQSVDKIGRGPIMVLVDESSSMNGERIIAAKGLALSLAWLARQQNRWCCLVGWSSSGYIHELVLDPSTPNSKLMDWACESLGGGTRPPVEIIPELFEQTNAPEGKTDIIWITDGECGIDERVIEEFQDWRKEHKCKVWTIGIGCKAESFEPFSDQTVMVSQLSTSEPVIEEIFSM